MHLNATDAKSRFGHYLAQAEREPVHVLKKDRVAGVIVSAARHAQLEALEQEKSMARRRKEFNDKYKDWIAAQNAHVEANGLWCDGMVAWPGQS